MNDRTVGMGAYVKRFAVKNKVLSQGTDREYEVVLVASVIRSEDLVRLQGIRPDELCRVEIVPYANQVTAKAEEQQQLRGQLGLFDGEEASDEWEPERPFIERPADHDAAAVKEAVF